MKLYFGMPDTCLKLALAAWIFNAASLMATPKLPTHSPDVLFGDASDKAAHLFQDDTDPDLYYVAPKRVVPLADPVTGKKLFKLSYSSAKNTGELQGVFRLGFDPAEIASEWSAIQQAQPHATLKQVDIIEGEFGIEMRQPGFTLLIGKGEIVKTQTGMDFPVHIELNSNGIAILQAQASNGNLAALTLNFEYRSYYMNQGQNFNFTAQPRQLLQEIQEDPTYKNEWARSELLSDFALKRFLISTFTRNLWQTSAFLDDDFNINLASFVFYTSLNRELSKILGRRFDLRERAMLSLDSASIPDQALLFKGTSPGQVTLMSDTAAMVIRGLCEQYAEAVYEEVTGSGQCLQIVGDGGGTPTPGEGGDDIWIPDF
jgi:hypothetical protein